MQLLKLCQLSLYSHSSTSSDIQTLSFRCCNHILYSFRHIWSSSRPSPLSCTLVHVFDQFVLSYFFPFDSLSGCIPLHLSFKWNISLMLSSNHPFLAYVYVLKFDTFLHQLSGLPSVYEVCSSCRRHQVNQRCFQEGSGRHTHSLPRVCRCSTYGILLYQE